MNNTPEIQPADNKTSSFIVPLINYSIIRVTGIDAEKFMQGQFSCDVREVTETQSRIGTANTLKGRAYAVFRIAKSGNDYLIRIPSDIANDFILRLKKYIVFSKAELKLDDSLSVVGIVGEQALSVIEPLIDVDGPLIDKLPTNIDGTECIDNNVFVKVPSSINRYELWCDKALAQSLIEPLLAPNSIAKVGTESDWNWFELSEGIAEVYTETQEGFIPQMLNLQHLNAISFKKGCYTGQEIIARMKYLGKLKKGMFLLSTRSTSTAHISKALPGSPVFENGTDKKRGTIVRSAYSASLNTTLTLAVLDIESTKTGVEFSLSENNQTQSTLIALPYEIQEEKQ